MKSNKIWKIKCNKELYDSMKINPLFHEVIRIAQIMNSLRYVLQSFAESKDDGTPTYQRYRTNTFFFAGALEYEAIETLKNSGLNKFSSSDQAL